MRAIPVTISAPLAHQLATHAGHSFDRGLGLVTGVAQFWYYVLLWTAIFLVVAAFTAVADVHVLADLRRGELLSLLRYFRQGSGMFFGLLLDRQTPSLARTFVGVALLYWLSSPWEVFPADWQVPGILDELIVTLAATKTFVYLCPERLVKRHAA